MPRDLPGYLFLRLGIGFFKILSPQTASRMGGKIARLIGPRTRFQKIAKRNLELCLPHTNHAEILAAMWDNLGRTIGEHPHLNHCAKFATLSDPSGFLDRLKETGGTLTSGHLANWEISVPVIQQKSGIQMYAAYRAPNNKLIDAYLQRERIRSGSKPPISKTKRGAIEMLRALKNNQTIGVLVDQKDNMGEPLTFFGHAANSTVTYAAMALSTGKPIGLLLMHRLPNQFGYAYSVEPINTDGLDAVTIAQNVTTRLEKFITQHPECFLWIHRRFDKTLYAASNGSN